MPGQFDERTYKISQKKYIKIIQKGTNSGVVLALFIDIKMKCQK